MDRNVKKTRIFSFLLMGLLSITLASCGETKHNFSSDWSHDETYHWHACADKNCTEVSDKAEHTFDSGVITTEATGKEAGVMTYTCTVCDFKKTKSIEKLTSSLVFSSSFSPSKVYDGEPVKAPKADDYSTQSNGKITVSWQKDGKKIEEAPRSVGTYSVVITSAETSSFPLLTATKEFSISTKSISYAKNYIYKPGKTQFTADASSLTGVIAGDDVSALITVNENVSGIFSGNKIDSIVLSGADKDNYTLDKTSVSISVLNINSGDLKCVLDPTFVLDKVYDGKALSEPTFNNIMFGTEKVVYDFVEFKVTWYDMAESSNPVLLNKAPVSAGNYRMTIDIIDNSFQDAETINKDFTISKKQIKNVEFHDVYVLKSTFEKTLTADHGIVGDDVVKANVEVSSMNAGTYTGETIKTLSLLGEKASNYSLEKTDVKVIISKIDFSDSTNTYLASSYNPSKTYDGKAVSAPLITDIRLNSLYGSFSEGLEYTVEWYKDTTRLSSAPVSAGSYRLVVNIASNDNQIGGTIEKNFIISKANLSNVSISNIYNGGKVFSKTLTAENGVLASDNVIVDITTTSAIPGTYNGNTISTIAMSGSGFSNYNLSTSDVTVEIIKLDFSKPTNVSFADSYQPEKTYDGLPAQAPTINDVKYSLITDKLPSISNFTVEWYEETGLSYQKLDSAPTDIGGYKVKMIFADDSIQFGGSIEKRFIILSKLISTTTFEKEFDNSSDFTRLLTLEDGLCEADVGLSSITISSQSANVGTYSDEQLVDYSVIKNGVVDDNYDLDGSITLKINKKVTFDDIQVTIDDSERAIVFPGIDDLVTFTGNSYITEYYVRVTRTLTSGMTYVYVSNDPKYPVTGSNIGSGKYVIHVRIPGTSNVTEKEFTKTFDYNPKTSFITMPTTSQNIIVGNKYLYKIDVDKLNPIHDLSCMADGVEVNGTWHIFDGNGNYYPINSYGRFTPKDSGTYYFHFIPSESKTDATFIYTYSLHS